MLDFPAEVQPLRKTTVTTGALRMRAAQQHANRSEPEHRLIAKLPFDEFILPEQAFSNESQLVRSNPVQQRVSGERLTQYFARGFNGESKTSAVAKNTILEHRDPI